MYYVLNVFVRKYLTPNLVVKYRFHGHLFAFLRF